MNSDRNPNNTSGVSPEALEADEPGMPLGIGDFSEEDVIIGGDAPRKKLSSGALIIILVIVVSAVGLFSMRTLTRASAAGSAPMEIEQSIEAFLGMLMRSGTSGTSAQKEGVLEVLNESYSNRQVPLSEVQRDPFAVLDENKPVVETHVASPTDPLASRRRARLEQFERAASQLRVGMILMGSSPMANVNNRVVRAGEFVPIDGNVRFRVLGISADRVDFVAEDRELGVRFERTVRLRRD